MTPTEALARAIAQDRVQQNLRLENRQEPPETIARYTEANYSAHLRYAATLLEILASYGYTLTPSENFHPS